MWLGGTAFGKQADALTRHQKGDLISVAGTLQVNRWTGQASRGRQRMRYGVHRNSDQRQRVPRITTRHRQTMRSSFDWGNWNEEQARYDSGPCGAFILLDPVMLGWLHFLFFRRIVCILPGSSRGIV